MGRIALFGHLSITHADETAQTPRGLAKAGIMLATAWRCRVFGDLPDGWTLPGVVDLIASALYISARQGTAKVATVTEAM